MFINRTDAGKKMAKRFRHKISALNQPIVIALPRGGVPVAKEIAKAFVLPFDLLCVKKIGFPYNKELALGAVSEFGDVYINEDLAYRYRMTSHDKKVLEMQAKNEVQQQAKRLRGSALPAVLENKNVLLIDDGIATGATIKAAIHLLKQKKAKKIIVMTPVISKKTLKNLLGWVDEVYALLIPDDFDAVGSFYQNFGQTSDKEVLEIINQFHP